MNNRIDQLRLPKDLDNYSVAVKEGGDVLVLTGLSTLNFFVGENNSGKSRLLRRMAANDSPRFRPSSYPTSLIKIRSGIQEELRGSGKVDWLNDVEGQWHELEFLSTNSDVGRSKTNLYNSMDNYGRQIGDTLRSLVRDAQVEFDAYVDSESFRQAAGIPWKRIYVPVLRGLRPVLEEGTATNVDLYAKRTEKDYFGGKFSGEIYSGLSFYRDLRNLLLGDHAQRTTAREFENFLSVELFGGEPVTLIPREGSDVVWFKLGNSPEREIHNMGDGLQHLIILTFPLFKNRSEISHVFLEEPELFLHPGMQRALIKAMRTFEKNQYFIATHSNHFLDLTLEFDDISIYTLHRLEQMINSEDAMAKFEITLVSSHDFRILEMLGARSSSVFLSNCTIWVEGITDRRYLGHYLRLYLECSERDEKHPGFIPRQDLHYSFVEYSGGNITHWSFLDQVTDPILVDRLCSKAMLITDKDKGKDERHKQLKEKMGERYHCLPCREVENLLTPEVLKSVMVEYGETDASNLEFSYNAYAKEPLGKFLDDLLKRKVRKGPYGDSSGTVTDKIKFCSLAIKAMPTKEDVELGAENVTAFTFDRLSPGAQSLTKKMYEFIRAANQF